MTNRNTEPSQGDGGNHQAPPDHLRSRGGNKVYKSGPLFISSKGIGWTSWKKRWFILTRTSLVFFRNDPSAIPQKGSEVNLTLGGIDLNNSGSVIVKADKKLLTVLFPDGRAFTLKAETSEDLYEWKTALEEALALAPSAALVMGQNGIFKNDQADAADEQLKDRQPVKSLVIGRPILLALEDIDGTPSFLEKALRFIEEHGIKVEGILRQAADVDDVECRVQEYEQGKSEFSPGEDPHVVADCVKYILRELPSSPVPASCCNALLEAYRTERGMRLTAMRFAICETFPEPNRRLLQRILMMMQTVASHKAQNRMSSSAVAACMAPLLLRPLLAGECELENDFDVGGDGSVQLLQAAAAANHAQAIVICLLEEYGNIFGEGSVSPELYSDSEESEELTDDDESFEGDGDDDMTEDSDADVDEDYEHASSGTCGEVGGTRDTDLYNDKGSEASETLEVDKVLDANRLSSSSPQTSLPHHNNVQRSESFQNQSNDTSRLQSNVSCELLGDDPVETSLVLKISEKNPSIKKSATISSGPANNVRRPTVWGRTPGRRNLSTESINFPIEDEDEIQRLEVTKTDLQNRIADEAKGNVKLQESLERRKKSLQERRLALEQDVARLQEQLHKERELRTVVESGLKISQVALPVSSTTDEKAMDDVVNFKQKADNLGALLNQQSEQTFGFVHDMCKQPQQTVTYHGKVMTKQDSEASAIPIIDGSTKSKQDNHLDKYDSDREMKQDPPLPSKLLVQNQQSDPSHSYKSSGAPGTSSAVESAIGSHALNNSKKLGSRGEGGNSTTSALSKLSNRLNFLKERRSQIANELQNMDRDQSSGQPIQNLERGRGSESRQSLQNIDTCQGSSGQPSEGLMVQNMDQEQSDCLSVPNLDRGKSESIPNVGKGRGSEGQSLMPPRTYSR